MTGRKDAKPVIITGELRIPRPGTDRLPAVLLLHGAVGASGLQDDWARECTALGIATLLVDNFTGRGSVSPGDDQAQRSRLAMVRDAYRALALLAKHPRIDAARLMVMGGARRGGAAHWRCTAREVAWGSLGTSPSSRRVIGFLSMASTWWTTQCASSTARRTTPPPSRSAVHTSIACARRARTSH